MANLEDTQQHEKIKKAQAISQALEKLKEEARKSPGPAANYKLAFARQERDEFMKLLRLKAVK